MLQIIDFGIKTGEQYLHEKYDCAFMFNSSKSKSGYFHSPNYPGPYPRNTECHYLFGGTPQEKVFLHFNYFDVEGVLPWVSFYYDVIDNIFFYFSCEAISASDYVEFSNFITRDRLYPRHCGNLQEFDVKSDRNFFRVTFQSNDRLDATGFNATYRFDVEADKRTLKPAYASKGSAKKIQLFINLVYIVRLGMVFLWKFYLDNFFSKPL